jgi:hypothetical protein
MSRNSTKPNLKGESGRSGYCELLVVKNVCLEYEDWIKHGLRFPPYDPPLLAERWAEDAMHALHVETHYLACGDVTGRLSAKSNDERQHHRNQRHGD